MRAESLAKALGGRRTGSAWMARCPAHDDREPSLAISETRDGKVLVCCHAGCDQRDVIAALHARGAWGRERNAVRFSHKDDGQPPHDCDHDVAGRMEAALPIWRSAKPAQGTHVPYYLASRGIDLPPPDALRFHGALKHPSGGVWPAMVALVTRGVDGEPIGIHRTFLSLDGNWKAPVEPAKMMLGSCRGGAVRLAPAGFVLMVGEGIETCLAAMQATGNPTWAALSTSGLRTLDLPAHVRDVIVLADGDDAGEAAARNCAWRWQREGRRVRIARPPRGMDFNDLLIGRAPRIEEGAP
jgi:putative DNA primase/helicase